VDEVQEPAVDAAVAVAVDADVVEDIVIKDKVPHVEQVYPRNSDQTSSTMARKDQPI
jgi:hypothetical protein